MAVITTARYGPGRFNCLRAGGHSANSTAQHKNWNNAVYLLRNPRPIQSPVQSQSVVRPFSWIAFQPLSIAAVQKNTDNGSTVINTAPAEIMGVVVAISSSKNPARALISRAKKRSRKKLIRAVRTGEKKRTPNALSPHSEVPKNCV